MTSRACRPSCCARVASTRSSSSTSRRAQEREQIFDDPSAPAQTGPRDVRCCCNRGRDGGIQRRGDRAGRDRRALSRSCTQNRRLTTSAVLEAVGSTVPLSVSRREDIARLRETAAGDSRLWRDTGATGFSPSNHSSRDTDVPEPVAPAMTLRSSLLPVCVTRPGVLLVGALDVAAAVAVAVHERGADERHDFAVLRRRGRVGVAGHLRS